MRALWQHLIDDERGFIVSSELVLVSTLVVLGVLTGLTRVRDSVNAELGDVAQAIGSLNQSYSYSGMHGCISPVCGVRSWTRGSVFRDGTDTGTTPALDYGETPYPVVPSRVEEPIVPSVVPQAVCPPATQPIVCPPAGPLMVCPPTGPVYSTEVISPRGLSPVPQYGASDPVQVPSQPAPCGCSSAPVVVGSQPCPSPVSRCNTCRAPTALPTVIGPQGLVW